MRKKLKKVKQTNKTVFNIRNALKKYKSSNTPVHYKNDYKNIALTELNTKNNKQYSKVYNSKKKNN